MNVVKKSLFQSLKIYTRDARQSTRPTITLSILESSIHKCRKPREFLQIDAQMVTTGFTKDTFAASRQPPAASRLLSFAVASPFFNLDYSYQLLLQIDTPNAFTWNTLMRGYIQRRSPQFCLPLYSLMLERNMVPDNYTHPILIGAASIRSSELEGMQFHAHVIKFGFDADVYALNTLINMYSVCGNLDRSPVLDSVSWNSILAAHVQAGNVTEAVRIYEQMPEQNIIATNSMIALFGRSNCVSDAHKLFDGMDARDVISWTAMISCYEQNELFTEALEMFCRMKREAVPLDEVVMVSSISACNKLEAMEMGEAIHAMVINDGLESYVNLQNALIHLYSNHGDIVAAQKLFDCLLDQISWNSMILCYSKCVLLGEARMLFDAAPVKDVVTWGTMIAGYAQHNRFVEALELFGQMLIGPINPNETTLVIVISACAHLSALEQGKLVHAYIKKNGFHISIFLGTTLIDMYMKCGSIGIALGVFDALKERGITSWNVVISGLAMNGLIKESLEKFAEMKCRVIPNEVTFVGVLSAFRYAGLVDEGRRHFCSMYKIYGILPNVKHYGCMVDLFGRAGLLKEAEELVESMPMPPDVTTWGALLGACKKHGATEDGKRIGTKLIELEPQHNGVNVLLANIYASKGKWDDVMKLRGTMRDEASQRYLVAA